MCGSDLDIYLRHNGKIRESVNVKLPCTAIRRFTLYDLQTIIYGARFLLITHVGANNFATDVATPSLGGKNKKADSEAARRRDLVPVLIPGSI